MQTYYACLPHHVLDTVASALPEQPTFLCSLHMPADSDYLTVADAAAGEEHRLQVVFD